MPENAAARTGAQDRTQDRTQNRTSNRPQPGVVLFYTLPAALLSVRETCRRFEADLIGAGFEAAPAGRVALVCAEALNNVVEHGQHAEGAGELRLEFSSGRRCRLRIADRGSPVPASVFRKPTPPVIEGKVGLPEGGFGLSIIHSLSDEVRYMRRGQENVLDIVLAP